MNIDDEIRLYSADSDVPALLWLSGKYHWPTQFRFVATYQWDLTPDNKMYRLWEPTPEGRVLFESGKL